MKSSTRFFSPCLFFMALLVASCSTNNNEGAELRLRQAINGFNLAFKNGNVSQLELMITEDYVHTNGNSKSIDKAAWLKYLRKREQEIEARALEVLHYEMNELEIAMHDDVAIVTGKIVVKSRREGAIQENEYRITNIWVQESGTWKRAGFHDGRIK